MNTKNLIIRWSLLTGGLIFIFWLGYYLIVGSIPIVTSINISDTVIVLPFGVSRWLDILIGPIVSIIVIIFFNCHLYNTENITIYGLILGLFLGMIFGLVIGGLHDGLPRALVLGAFYGIFYSLCLTLLMGLYSGFTSFNKHASNSSITYNKISNWLKGN